MSQHLMTTRWDNFRAFKEFPTAAGSSDVEMVPGSPACASPSSGSNSAALTDEGTQWSSSSPCCSSSLPVCIGAGLMMPWAAAVGVRVGCWDEAAAAAKSDSAADRGDSSAHCQCSGRDERPQEEAAKRRRLAPGFEPEPAAAAARRHECKADQAAALASAALASADLAFAAAPVAAALVAASVEAAAAEGYTATALSRGRLSSQQRALIVGWMREVCAALGLHPSTLFSAASLLDRFVAAAEVLPPEGLLQLLALACMSVAVKYNESVQVQPSTWLGLAMDPGGRHNLYQARDLQRCEFSLLQTIQWRLHEPTTHTFLEHFLMCLRPAAEGHAGQQASGGATFRRRTEGGGPNAAVVTDAIAVRGIGYGCCQGDDSSFDPWDSEVAATALALAELSLPYDIFLLFDYSTIALSCVSLAAQRPAAMDSITTGAALLMATVPPPPPPSLAVAYDSLLPSTMTIAAVCAAATGGGLPLEHLAPPAAGLSSCMDALQMYYCWA